MCLQFNSSKSKVVVFGKAHKEALAPIYLNDSSIDYVHEWKYLGVTIVGGNSLTFSARTELSSFFRATNAITSVLRGAHEHTILTLIYSNCVPIISYAGNVKQFSA